MFWQLSKSKLISLLFWVGLGYFLPSAGLAQNSYELNTDNTKVTFRAKHLGFLDVDGTFNKLEGALTIEGSKITSADVVLYTNSITTKNKSRDRSLKSEGFLNSRDYPTIRFKSSGDVPQDHVKGTLSIKGKSKVVSVQYTFSKQNGKVLLKAEYILNRTEFDLGFGTMDSLISEEVSIKINLELPPTN